MKKEKTKYNGGRRREGQTAIEYMLLLGIVVSVVLVAFNSMLPRVQSASNMYFDKVAVSLMGDPVNETWLESAGAGGNGT